MSYTERELQALIKKAVDGAMSKGSGHKDIDELLNCPDCYKEVIKKLDASEYECEDCHLPMGSEKLSASLKECPRCHGDHRIKTER